MDKEINRTGRGSGRTTQALTQAWEHTQDPTGARIVYFVVSLSKMDDYNFRLLVKIAGVANIAKYSMAHREVNFKNGGRIRFINFDSDYLIQWAPGKWQALGYRRDIPVIWDHDAEDRWAEREIARNAPPDGRTLEARRRKEMGRVLGKKPVE